MKNKYSYRGTVLPFRVDDGTIMRLLSMIALIQERGRRSVNGLSETGRMAVRTVGHETSIRCALIERHKTTGYRASIYPFAVYFHER